MSYVTTVLVIDDDPIDRIAVERLLRNEPEFQVLQAGTIFEAVEICKSEHVDAALLDLTLKESRGLETVLKFRRLIPDIPVVVLSGLDDMQIALQSLGEGAQDYLVKGDLSVDSVARSIRHGIHRQELQKQLLELAMIDTLTSLPNRKKIEQDVADSLEKAKKEPGYQFAVAFIDVDNFKLINDVHGHAIGDDLLSELSGRLTSIVSGCDQVARFGGDEFVVLFADINEGHVSSFLDRLAKSVDEPFLIDGHKQVVSVSAGVTQYDQRYESVGEMLRDADTAMYEAKRGGKARHQWFSSSMRDDVVRRLGLESQMLLALERGEFQLHYQPIVELGSEKIVRFEALLRWMHPTKGLIPPLAFISAAESNGSIIPLGDWVMRTACEQLAEWRKDFDVGISVNVSPVQLAYKTFTQTVFSLVDEFAVPHGCLDLEITESSIMQNPAESYAALNTLKDAGVRVSIDDFGTGYSSLAQLNNFKFDVLKIDQSFVSSMLDGEDALVRAILGLSDALQLDVIAEGIERKSQADRLRQMGCLLGQGFLFGRPTPKEDATQLLHREAARALTQQHGLTIRPELPRYGAQLASPQALANPPSSEKSLGLR